jgi:E3 ubiquitin-protein ligase BRE1
MRQMREYKREKNTVEVQLNELESRSKYHDDHLRTLDVWFDQVSARCIVAGRTLMVPS